MPLAELAGFSGRARLAGAAGRTVAGRHRGRPAGGECQRPAAHALRRLARQRARRHRRAGRRPRDPRRAARWSRMWPATTWPSSSSASQGTLGVMTDVTLKLTPLPRLRQTFTVAVDDVLQGIQLAQATAAHWLMAAGVVVRQRRGGRASPDLHAGRAAGRCARRSRRDHGRAAQGRRPRHRGGRRAHRHGAVVRPSGRGGRQSAACAPACRRSIWRSTGRCCRRMRAAAGACFVDVAAGLLYLRGSAEDVDSGAAVGGAGAPAGAGVARLCGRAGWAGRVLAELDRRGYRADGAAIADAIRQRWDPQRVFAA